MLTKKGGTIIISIHTLELTLETNTKDFNSLLSNAYKKAKKYKHRLGYSTKHTSNDVRVDDSMARNGITVEYHNCDYRKMVKFRINPSEVLGGTDLQLWKPNKSNINELIDRINDSITDYFDDNYELNDLILSRVEFTANLDVGKSNVPAYINLMYKIGKVKKFSAKYSKHDFSTEKIEKKHSFDLKGNSNGIEFTLYDKEADLKKKGKEEKSQKAKGILRAEIRLKKRKDVQQALYTLTDDEGLSTKQQLRLIAKNCQKIFMDNFIQIVPFGNFYKLKDAEEIIAASDFKKSQKEKMLRLLKLVPEKKSLYLAIKELNIRDIKKVMEGLAILNVSPVTISKREKIHFLNNLYNFLEL